MNRRLSFVILAVFINLLNSANSSNAAAPITNGLVVSVDANSSSISGTTWSAADSTAYNGTLSSSGMYTSPNTYVSFGDTTNLDAQFQTFPNGSGANTYTYTSSLGTFSNGVAFSPSTTTTYTAFSTSTAGCTSTNNPVLTITVNPLPTLTISGTSTLCNLASTTLSVSGALTYTWSNSVVNSTVFLNPTSSTVYSVTGTNSNNCVNTATIAVSVVTLPIVSATPVNPAICINATNAINGNGANTYTFSSVLGTFSNGAVFSPSITTAYTISGTSTAGCTSTNNPIITITVNPLPTVSLSATNPTICINATTALNGSGANTYTFNSSLGTFSNGVSFSPSVTTSYTVSGTSTAGCTSTNNPFISIAVNPLPTVNISGTPTLCNLGSTTLTANGASTYTWSNASIGQTVFLSPIANSNYTVTATNSNNCVNTATYALTVIALPTISATAVSSVICLNGTTSISGNGANTYTINSALGTFTSGAIITPSITNTYTVSGTSTAGRTSTNNPVLTITVNALPNVSVSALNSVICLNATTALNGSGAISYTFNSVSGTYSNGVSFTPSATASPDSRASRWGTS